MHNKDNVPLAMTNESSPPASSTLLRKDSPKAGCVAQWLVHLHDNLEVLGSIPGGGLKNSTSQLVRSHDL